MELQKRLTERDYLPILRFCDGSPVTRETWGRRREEMKRLLETCSYGVTPDVPVRVSGEETGPDNVMLTFSTSRGSISFPIELHVPEGVPNPPVILLLSFRHTPDPSIPLDSILRAGYALVVAVYTDMVNDAHFGDFSDGIAAHFGTCSPRRPDEWGKIGMWAYGASRILDYLTAFRPDLDTSRTAVIGHSRLGKTALWCGALDERFSAVISNESGYGGAASSKHGTGERVTDFIRVGSWDWFCENFQSFADAEDRKPYDQSFLSAMIAPRLLCVGSAAEDRGADPESEFLTTLHASSAWELLGSKGLICPDRMPVPGDSFLEGNVGYHLRAGKHALTPEDWDVYLRFLDIHFKGKDAE